MNYNFYANSPDKMEVLDFIFYHTDLRVYDHASPYDQEVTGIWGQACMQKDPRSIERSR